MSAAVGLINALDAAGGIPWPGQATSKPRTFMYW
jgi:hypothetical protein